jgi:hypothetical protein
MALKQIPLITELEYNFIKQLNTNSIYSKRSLTSRLQVSKTGRRGDWHTGTQSRKSFLAPSNISRFAINTFAFSLILFTD